MLFSEIKYLRLGLFFLLSLCSCKSNTDLKYEIFIPSNKDVDRFPVVFFLHGWGGTLNQFIPFVKEEIKGAVLVFPQAPFPEGEKGNSWSKMSLGKTEYSESLDQAEFSRQKLNELIKFIILNYPVDSNNLFICGTSQGAMMALRVGLNRPYHAKGLICINGRLPMKMLNDSISYYAKSRLGVYVVNGIHDTIIPIQSGKKLVHELKLNGLNVESHESDTGHALQKELIRSFKPWLESKINEK